MKKPSNPMPKPRSPRAREQAAFEIHVRREKARRMLLDHEARLRRLVEHRSAETTEQVYAPPPERGK